MVYSRISEACVIGLLWTGDWQDWCVIFWSWASFGACGLSLLQRHHKPRARSSIDAEAPQELLHSCLSCCCSQPSNLFSLAPRLPSQFTRVSSLKWPCHLSTQWEERHWGINSSLLIVLPDWRKGHLWLCSSECDSTACSTWWFFSGTLISNSKVIVC